MENKKTPSQFELMAATLSDKERQELYNKLNNIVFIKDEMELNIEDDLELNKFIKNYTLSFFDKIKFFFLSIFSSKTRQEFVIDKELKTIENKFRSYNPPWFDSYSKNCLYGFFKPLKELYEFQNQHSELIRHFIDILNESFKHESLILDLVKFIIP